MIGHRASAHSSSRQAAFLANHFIPIILLNNITRPPTLLRDGLVMIIPHMLSQMVFPQEPIFTLARAILDFAFDAVDFVFVVDARLVALEIGFASEAFVASCIPACAAADELLFFLWGWLRGCVSTWMAYLETISTKARKARSATKDKMVLRYESRA